MTVVIGSTEATRSQAQRLRLVITGVVQGVGFRPFVFRLATELGLSGLVGNDTGRVFVEVQGAQAAVEAFVQRIRSDGPPLASVSGVEITPLEIEHGGAQQFVIVASHEVAGARTLVPADVATCAGCLEEMADPSNRRYRHPFITCTDCGPRFTIIRDLPYDRPATTMAGFDMCPACRAEYDDPSDRRFHAQPVACHSCGPALWFERDGVRVDGPDDAIAAAQEALAAGLVVSVKGVGGYHLACRADDADAVRRLRARKARTAKAFAVLVRDVDTARSIAEMDDDELRVLTSPARPIVLLRRAMRGEELLADEVAPDNPLVGVLLPYAPVHHLLLAQVPGRSVCPPSILVFTSANVSDEPLCFDDADAMVRLPVLADAVLTHDRPIEVPCDDSVVRVVAGAELPIRRSRGFAPLPVPLGSSYRPILAVGAEVKNTCCVIDGEHAFLSGHIGDMGSVDTLRAFERAVGQLTRLRRLTPEVFAVDAHPGYASRQWAERHGGGVGEPRIEFVQHHHAHVAALLAEHGMIGTPIIGVAFDGTGFGDDATVWGGEILHVGSDATRYTRVGHLSPVALAGGDAAVRNPCRMTLAYLSAAGVSWDEQLPPVRACTPTEQATARAQLSSGLGVVQCTSMGRLFDAVSSILDVRHRVSYEGQAAIELEFLAASAPVEVAGAPAGRFGITPGSAELDYRPVIAAAVDSMRNGIPRDMIARDFHVAVAEAVTARVAEVARASGTTLVGLTGGVFQNVLLTELCRQGLLAAGLQVITHHLVPANDGGLALGQAVVAALRTSSRGEG